MLLILMNGLPCSGCTTSTTRLSEYLDKKGVFHKVISKGRTTKREEKIENVNAMIYRWIVEKSERVAIVDAGFLNYFDRSTMFDTIESAENASNQRVTVVAIQHNRSNKFILSHNSDEGHYPYPKRHLLSSLNHYQQAIQGEGFDAIFMINGDAYLNCEEFCQYTNRKIEDSDLPEVPMMVASDPADTVGDVEEEPVVPASMRASDYL